MLTELFYPEARYGGFTRVDGTVAFYSRVQAMATPASVVIDFGCGRGAADDDPVPFRRQLRTLRGRVSRVIGLDIEPNSQNPIIDEFRMLNVGDPWPIADSSADIVLADNVLEHLGSPGCFFSEARRVLRQGGRLCIRTPNRWGYVAIGSLITPNRFHTGVLSILQRERHSDDIFGTHYRCNTRRVIKRQLREHGFSHPYVYGHNPEPSYLQFSKLAYRIGRIYERLAPEATANVLFAFASTE